MFRKNVWQYINIAAVVVAVAATSACGMGGKGPGYEAEKLETNTSLPGAAADKEAVPGEVVVVFKDGTSDAMISDALAKVPAKLKERSAVNTMRMVVTVAVGKEAAAVTSFREMDCVRAAEVNYILHALDDEKTKDNTGSAEGANFNDESMTTGFEAGPTLK